MLELQLPFPPTVNTMWRRGQRSTYLSERGRKYRADAVASVLEQFPDRPLVDSLDSRLAVSITLYPPDRRQRDLDNYPKAILDTLTHAGVWVDDSQIDKLTVARGERVKHGRADVTIEVIK